VSYIGSDDGALCDGPCNRMYPPGWPDWITPWPVPGPVFDPDGRMTEAYRDNFHLCLDCLQAMVMRSRLTPDSRDLAFCSRARWRASQHLLDQAESVVRGAV
jgi:hypothetical protein